MHFATHQKLLTSAIETALKKSKSGIIEDFKGIILTAKFLYKTDQFDFWLKTIEEVAEAEIPMSKFGHKEAVGVSSYLNELDRNRVVGNILHICEYLFTYANEEESCELFGIFHFYSLKETGVIFKLSEMGILEGVESVLPNSYRIAYTSELAVAESELYI